MRFYYNNKDLNKDFKLNLNIALMLLSLLLIIPTTSAADPSGSISPNQTEQALNDGSRYADSHVIERISQQDLNCASKSKPSLWNWLTKASHKPAYFHYIDIIELLQ